MSYLNQHIPKSSLSAGVALGLASSLLLTAFYRRREASSLQKITASSREALLSETLKNDQNLVKLDDILPGNREVKTPYGSINVYEWGPEDGPKVLFLHGISTPCFSQGEVAHKLVEKGCRVMLFDLFGRGLSDLPDLPLNIQTYTTQIFLVLASSSLHWNRFTLVGYSLGGGISAAFTAHFPHLISSLVLLAPGGLIRTEKFTWRSKLINDSEGILPNWFSKWMIWKRMSENPSRPTAVKPSSSGRGESEPVTGPQTAITETYFYNPDTTPILPGKPDITETSVTRFQLQYNSAFIPALLSSYRYAPIHSQHELFAQIGRQRDSLDQGKVLLIVGRTDPIIAPDETIPDWKAVLDADAVEAVELDCGHEVPIGRPIEVADAVWKFWLSSSC